MLPTYTNIDALHQVVPPVIRTASNPLGLGDYWMISGEGEEGGYWTNTRPPDWDPSWNSWTSLGQIRAAIQSDWNKLPTDLDRNLIKQIVGDAAAADKVSQYLDLRAENPAVYLGGSEGTAPLREVPPPPTSEQQFQWEQKARDKGIADTLKYAQEQWMKANNLTEWDLRRLGQTLPGITQKTQAMVKAEEQEQQQTETEARTQAEAQARARGKEQEAQEAIDTANKSLEDADVIHNSKLDLTTAVEKGFTDLSQYTGWKVSQEDIDKAKQDISSTIRLADNQRMDIKDWNSLDEKYQHIGLTQGFDTMDRMIKQDIKDFEDSHTKLPDGQWMTNTDLEAIKKETPKLWFYLKSDGYDKTYGQMEKDKASDPKAYFADLQKYGVIPDKALYVGSDPDGNVHYVGGIETEDKSNIEIAKQAGIIAAETLIPGVWIKDIKDMPKWQIGLNAGLDLLVLVPVAGWGAKLAGKAILRAGTETIIKSLAEELPRALVKAGERELASESATLAKGIKGIDKLLIKVEKTAIATAKAEELNNIDKFVKAVKAESVVKAEYAQAMRKWGSGIAVFNSKLAETSVKGVGKEGLSKAIGMASKAEDFANYVAGVQKEITRLKLDKAYFTKTTPATVERIGAALNKEVKAYVEVPKTIGEAAIATAKTIKGGAREGAAYLRGEQGIAQAVKGGTATEAYIKGGQEGVQKSLSNIERLLAKQAESAQSRLAKYQGKAKTLDKWDAYIKENWPPSGGKWYPRDSQPMTGGGGVATAETTATMTSSQAAGRGGQLAQTYTVPIRTIGGTRIFTVIVDPQKGTTEIVRNPETVTLPQIIIEEGGKWPAVAPIEPEVISPYSTKAPAKVKVAEPEVMPHPEVSPEPVTEPKIKVHFIERPKAKTMPRVMALAEIAPSTQTKAALKTSTTAGTATGTESKVGATTKPAAATKVSPAFATRTQATTKTQPAIGTKPAIKTQPTIKTQSIPATKIVPKPAIKTPPKTETPRPIKIISPAKPRLRIIPPGRRPSKNLASLTPEELSASVAFQHGELGRQNKREVWIVRAPPDYQQQIVVGELPKGVHKATDSNSAFKTLQKVAKGKLPLELTGKLGFATYAIETKGEPSIKFSVEKGDNMALTATERQKFPRSKFAIPEKAPGSGSYPIPDEAHARNALARVSQFGTEEEKRRVREAVHREFPYIEQIRPIRVVPNTKVLKVHEDGDLTVKKGKNVFVLTTEGNTFKNVPKSQVPKFKLPKARVVRVVAGNRHVSPGPHGVYATKRGRTVAFSGRRLSRRSRRLY